MDRQEVYEELFRHIDLIDNEPTNENLKGLFLNVFILWHLHKNRVEHNLLKSFDKFIKEYSTLEPAQTIIKNARFANGKSIRVCATYDMSDLEQGNFENAIKNIYTLAICSGYQKADLLNDTKDYINKIYESKDFGEDLY